MDITKKRQKASEYFSQGKYTQAIALWQQCVDADPTLISDYWYLGLAWLLQGEESAAQAIWLSALAQGTPEKIDEWMVELIEVLTVEANRHLRDRKLQLAERIYWQILELDSHQFDAHYNLGHTLAQQGNLDGAVACWQKATDIKPDFAEAYQEQGCIFQKLEEFEEAIACYLKALEIKPDCQIAYNLGLCFFQRGRLDEAISCFKNATQMKPAYSQAYSDWGSALLRQSRLDEAIIYLKKATQIKLLAQSYCQWVNILKVDGRDNEQINANACLLKTLFLQSVSSNTYFYLGRALFRNNNIESAIAAYQKAIQLQPTAEIYLELGKTLTRKENFNEAITAYQKVLEFNPDLAEAWFYLGNILSTSSKWDEAIVCYRKTLELQSDGTAAYYRLGIALAHLNQANEAIACFRKAMEINSDIVPEIYNVMRRLHQQGKLDNKNLDFQQLFPVDPPTEFYASTWDWAVTSNVEKSNYIGIHPKNIIHLTLPKTLDKAIHFSFRFGNKVELPATFVAILPNGRYWLNKGQDTSAIITSNNKLLADISPEFPALSPGHPDKHPNKHSIFSKKKLPPIQSIDGTVAVLSGLLNNIYFHWMFDILPRIELLQRSGIDMSKIDKFLVNSHLPFQKETLNALGMTETKLIQVDDYHHIEATRLVVPSFPGSIAWMPKWVCNFLRSSFLDKKAIEASVPIDYLYISRKNAENRRVINEDEVISLLNKFGFKSVTLESMSVVEQAALLANAKVIVAPHGGGLTNTVFCNPGTKVIEIFSPNYVYPCYWLVANLVNLEYYYLLGEVPEGFYLHQLLYPNPRIEDIFINIDKLLKIMKFAGLI